MSNIRIELNDEGIQELLHEAGSTTCAEIAERIASECGDGYASDTYRAGTRTIASVSTASGDADPDEILRHLT